jgi:hypothetical protein
MLRRTKKLRNPCSESVPLKRIYADILPTSVRQRTPPCFNGCLHIGEGAVAAAERSRLGLPALSRKICSAEMPSRIKEPNERLWLCAVDRRRFPVGSSLARRRSCQVSNGVISAPIMFVMMRMAAKPKIMDEFVVGKRLKVLGWLATAVMAVAVAIMLAQMLS